MKIMVGSERYMEESDLESSSSETVRTASMLAVESLDVLEDKVFYIKAAAVSSGSSTLNINGLGAKSIKKYDKDDGVVDIGAGDIQVGQICIYTYDGTQFVLLNPVLG